MTVYFDKENYINYVKSIENDPVGQDTRRMLKQQLDVHMNFDRADLDEYEEILLDEFEEGVSNEFKLTFGNVIQKPLKKDSLPSMTSIYLINDTDSVKNLKLTHAVLVGGLGEEIRTLGDLIINSDYSFHDEKIIGKEIRPEKHLDILGLPFTTLVIVDRYIFKGPEASGNLGLYEYNLNRILKQIYERKRGPSNLVFIYQVNVKVPRTDPKYDEGPDIAKLLKKIKNATHKHCPAPEIYFIGVPAGSIDDEHDRFIISNYLRIKSGDCTVYFNSAGKILTKSLTTDFYSLAFRKYRDTNKNLILKLNKLIEDVLKNYNKYSSTPSSANKAEIIKF
jgi:hypothetical protein